MEIYRDELSEHRQQSSRAGQAVNNTKFGENKENQEQRREGSEEVVVMNAAQQSPSRGRRNNRKDTDVVQRTVLEDVTHRYTGSGVQQATMTDDVIDGGHQQEPLAVERRDEGSRPRRPRAPGSNFTRMMR
eukprot:jgi/Picre1/29154/NNA_004547.t1